MNGIASAGGASAVPLGAALRAITVAVVVLAGCHSEDRLPRPGSEPAPARPPAAASVAAVPFPGLPLGVPDLMALGWRERGGQEAFRRARAAERQSDWAGMVVHCQAALAADPSHLEASWLLAAGLARTGRFSEVVAPLLQAVAGDPAKWASPALQLQLFAPFWASGAGDRVRPWISALEPRLQAALAHAVILLHRGRLVAFDRETQRWFNLSRRLRVLGALVSRPAVAFVAQARAAHGPTSEASGAAQLGILDLRTGVVQELALPPAHHYEVVALADPGAAAPAPVAAAPGQGAAAPAPISIAVRSDGGPWMQVAGDKLVARASQPRAAATRLQVVDGRASLSRPSAAGIIADWDQTGMASALRIRRSNRLVALPAPALIDRQRLSWSPGASKLALVASLDDCDHVATAAPARRYLAYLVDPITGALRELAQARTGLEVEWIGDQALAVASERGVELFDLGTDTSQRFEGEVSLPVPVHRSRCATEPAVAPPHPGDDLDDL